MGSSSPSIGILAGFILFIIGVSIFATNCGFLRKKCDNPIKFIGNITDYNMTKYQCGKICSLYARCDSGYSKCYKCVLYEPVYCYKITAQAIYNHTKICQYVEFLDSNQTKMHNGSPINVYVKNKKCSFINEHNYFDGALAGFVVMIWGSGCSFVYSIFYIIMISNHQGQMTNIVNPIGII